MSRQRATSWCRRGAWLGPLVVAVSSLHATAAGDRGLNTLSDLKVIDSGRGAQVVVVGNRQPTFTVFRLSEPDRLVVDLSSADASAIKGHHEGKGPVAGVVASQFSDARASVGRVLVALDGVSQYDVRADGNRVVISVDGGKPASAEAPPAAMPAPVKVAQAEPKAEPAPVQPEPAVEAAAKVAEEPVEAPAVKVAEKPAEAPAAPEAAPAAAAKPENVVAAEVDEIEVKNPASRITALRLSRDTLRIGTDGEVPKFELLELTDPPRLALDVYGVGLKAKAPRNRSAWVKDVRVGAHADKVRVVVDVAGQMPRYRAVRSGHGLELRLAAAAKPSRSEAVASAPELSEGEIEVDGQRIKLSELAERPAAPAPVPAAPAPAPVEAAPIAVKPQPAAEPKVAQVRPAEVKEVAFHESQDGGRLEIKLSAPTTTKVERPDPGTAVLTFGPAMLPKRLERSLDTSALGTPVKMVSTFPVPGAGERIRVVVAASGKLSETLTATSSGLSWKLTATAPPAEAVAVAQRTAGFSTEADSYAALGAPRQRRFTGKRVSFEFKDIDIHNLLRVIAEVSKKNVVVADDVSGRVTIRLRNVPWDQALELILRSKGLGKEEIGNIIRVAPLKTLEEEAKLRAERKKSLIIQEELIVRLIPVNYAIAGDLAARVKDVLTDRGTVTVDARTNVLIVKDVASNIARANSLVQSLDAPTPQVLIESRIVEANSNFTRQIGVQWGGLGQMAPGTGNPTGLLFPNTVSVRGGSSPEGNLGVLDTPNFAVNLPAAVGTGSGGALGFVFGSVGGALALNLRLSALENQGTVKTISAPKVTTLDNNTAKISQGISIPFSQVSAQGVNTSFIEARLSLEVTPHITQDGSVLMAIKAENNQPDPSNTGANGQPSIQRKEANTQVLVKDGDTTVIGGIYVRRGATSTATIPILGRIPLLGFLFRNDSETDQRQELLIFITPRIINRQTIAQSL